MKTKLEKDEWYPIYTVDTRFGRYEVEMTEEEMAQVVSAFEQFYKIQRFLKEKCKESNHD
jgi:hypothetical protein